MQKIDFSVGNEKRFSDFITALNAKDKIALVSHTDLDGVASAKVVNKVVEADIIRFVNYEDLNDKLVKELKREKIKQVILCDLNIKDKEFVKALEKFAQILIIDHHPIKEDYNSEKTVFLNPFGEEFYCSTYICYYLFSKIQNLEKLDWLVACASISDFAYLDNKEWMKGVYEKYGDKFILNNGEISKNGKMWSLQWRLNLALVYYKDNLEKVFDLIGEEFGDIENLDKNISSVQKDIDSNLNKFESERIEIHDGYFFEINSRLEIKALIANILSAKYPNKTIIIGTEEKRGYFLSARRQDKRKDMGALLERLVNNFENSSSGGHVPAAGARFLLKDKERFLERIKKNF